MRNGHKWRVERAASDLAQLLKVARAYITQARPRVCCDCGHLFTLPSLRSGRRCLRCATTRDETTARP